MQNSSNSQRAFTFGSTRRIAAVAVAAALFFLCGSAFAGTMQRGQVVIPESSLQHPEDLGERAHTNVRLLVPAEEFTWPQYRAGLPPYIGYFYETPASLACIYKLVTQTNGCNPNYVTANSNGGSKAIAVVDAYDAPNAAGDLAAFSSQFGLPAANFQKVYASGSVPPYDAGWELEESLDIQMVHAMAPKAKIYLVEAASNSFADLFKAIQVASGLVAAAGGGEVTMSWSSYEWPGETSYDSYFTTTNVVYFASTGDWGFTGYPSVSPNVVAAGGTSVSRNATTGAFQTEGTWDAGGGGPSLYESRPAYQSAISGVVGAHRGVPDMAAVANPDTGVWVYDSHFGGWCILGGTSVSSPLLAGIVNSAGHFAASTSAELTTVYANMAAAGNFRDVAFGFCGPWCGYMAGSGWDFCTGVGSPTGMNGK
ncbi:MAG TPA: S53 family peptidase [Syntrophobacteraceae bacterium]|nr:S53 family peptidase [Syntrophobacteraceae bacterium]